MERTRMYNERGNARRRALKRVRELIKNEQNEARMRDTNSELDNDSEEYDTQISQDNDQGFDTKDLEVNAEAFCTNSERHAPRRTNSERHAPRRTNSERHAPRGTNSERHAPRRISNVAQQTSSLQTSLLCNILTNQEMIMEQMRTVFRTLRGMQATDEAEIDLDPNLLPLPDVGSVQSLEEQLQSSPELYNQLVKTLALKGGLNIRECVWRIMHAVFTNSLARNINMRGINGKIGFQRLQLRDVVIAAVRCNRHTSGATDQEIDSTVKRWFHLAPDRDGGRMERMKRKLDSTTS